MKTWHDCRGCGSSSKVSVTRTGSLHDHGSDRRYRCPRGGSRVVPVMPSNRTKGLRRGGEYDCHSNFSVQNEGIVTLIEDVIYS